ncbi:phosphoglycolate phosphatase [Amylibacter ulvae]|uniref:phosphoglycolate phosphatase n=1 Tax=Paramylibacter ulvae TaxID=1651968 RepID=A0ABQ3D1Y0_9RHOB|nr:HAD-IA family hydrolase [Amylibacter ulvae]GHA53367.1 phosphoglycolate phosphatase [Amylibacter ulvae]
MKSAIFDLDGTLADTSADLLEAANACFINLGHGAVLDAKNDALTAFAGGRAMLNLGFSRINPDYTEADIDTQHPIFLDYYSANLDVHTVLYDGVIEALDHLQGAGYALGICTNKPEGLAVELVKRLKIDHYFGALVGADTLPVRKPDPEHLFETIRRIGGTPDKSVLIGDTITDRKTSTNANVPSILVTFGPSGHAIADLAPEALLHHYDDLPNLLSQMLD